MKINEYNQMMSYLTRPAKSETEYEEVAMTGPFIKGGKKVIDKLIKKGKVKKGEAPKTDVEKVQAQKKSFDQTEKELAKSGQIPVRDDTGPKTKTIKTILNADQLRALGRKEGISEEDVEKFLSGELGLLKRGQARGVVQRDKEGNIVIKDKYSKKYDPLRANPVFKDEVDPSTLSTEDLIEFRKTNRAGKGQFTNAEAIIARLENTIKETSPDDETYNYVTTTFPNFIKELKANPKLAENENVWNSLMGELPSDQRFIKYDDGTVDFQTKKTTHNFKLREDLDTDRTGPNVPDDDPNMFDDMFDRMQKQMEDYIPGEEPLTKKKRTLNAEGGMITDRVKFGQGSDYLKANYPDLYLEIEKLQKELKGTGVRIVPEVGKKQTEGGRRPIIRIQTEPQYSKYAKGKKKSFAMDDLEVDGLNELKQNAFSIKEGMSDEFLKTQKKLGLKRAQIMRDKYSKKGKYGDRTEVKKQVNKIIEEIGKGERPIYDINKLTSGELIDTRLQTKKFLQIEDRTKKPAYLTNKNFKLYVDKILPKYRSILSRVQQGKEKETTELFKNATVNNIDMLQEKYPAITGYDIPKNVGEHMMNSIDRHVSAGGKKFELISGDNMSNFVFKEKSTGKKFSANIVNQDLNNPRWKNYVKTYQEVKDINYNTPFLDKTTGKQITGAEAFRKLSGFQRGVPVEFDHFDKLGVYGDPINNVGVSTRSANVAANMNLSEDELKKIFGRTKDIDLKGNKQRVINFLQRSLVKQAQDPSFKLKKPTEIIESKKLGPVAPSQKIDVSVKPGVGLKNLQIPTDNILQNVVQESDKFKNMTGSIDPQLLGIPQIAEGIEKYGIPAAKKAAPYVKTGVKTGAKVAGIEGVASLPFLGLDTYFGTRPGDVLPNILTLGQYELRQMAPGSPRRAEFAARFGYGDEYINATKKMKDATTMFGGAKDKETLYGLMDEAGIGLTPEEKYAFDVAGGSKFDDYELIRAEQQAQSYDQVKLPKSVEESKDPFNIFIGKPAYKIASEYFQPGKYDTPRYDFSGGGSPKDKKDKREIAGLESKLPIDPNMPQDPGRRNFLEKMGIGSLGIGALMTGAVKFAPEAAKVVKEAAPDFSSINVPAIVEELYLTIKQFGKQTDYPKPGSGDVKYEMGPYKLEEGPGGYNITKTNDRGEFGYSEEYFGVYKDPETGAIEYEELTVQPDMDGKLKDVDYGVDAQTYREIGEDLSKTTGQDVYKVIAEEDIKGVLDDGGVIMDQGVLKSGK